MAAAVEQAAVEDREFTLASLAQATGLSVDQIFSVLRYMLRAGLVQAVGERREAGRSGRGVRVYRALGAAARTPTPPKAGETILGRVRAVVVEFSALFDFTATDIARRLVLHREPVRLALASLEREGLVRTVVEIRPNEIVGRPAQRWTSNPDNMATQSYLQQKLREIEGS